MNPEPVVRLHLFFATENDRALIVRQGPSRQFRMILWHRNTDTFEDGQWIRQKVYIERCSLSPDGRHFIYFALDGRWSSDARGSYTALSRPPYWTALALFPEGDTWGGGGVFLDSERFWASGDADILGRTEGLTRVHIGQDDDAWRDVVLRYFRRSRETVLPSDDMADAGAEVRNGALDRYDTQGGLLYRRHGMELELIRDFTDMAFEPILAPYDWRDEREAARWHRLDGET